MVSHPETGSDSPIGSDRDRGRDSMKAPEFTKSGSSCSMTNLLLGKLSNLTRRYYCTAPACIYFRARSTLVGLAHSLLR